MAGQPRWRSGYSPSGIQERQTVSTYCRNWCQDGTWKALHERLRAWTRAGGGAESPSEVILARPTVHTVARVPQAVGFGCFKAT